MRKSEALPSKYLSAADVGNQTFKLVVANVVMEKMDDDGKMKPVMSFHNTQKGLPINATNWDNMASVYGDESGGWIGKQVELYTEATRMMGQPTRGVRIRPVAGPDTAAAFQGQALSQAPLEQPTALSPAPAPQPVMGPGQQAALAAQVPTVPVPTAPPQPVTAAPVPVPSVTQPVPAQESNLDDEVPF